MLIITMYAGQITAFREDSSCFCVEFLTGVGTVDTVTNKKTQFMCQVASWSICTLLIHVAMWDIVWVSPQEHRSVSVRHHVFLQAPQCPWPVRKRFRRDHCCRGGQDTDLVYSAACCRGRVKPGCRIVGSSTKWALTTGADFQDSLHWLLMSVGVASYHRGFLDVRRCCGGLRMSWWMVWRQAYHYLSSCRASPLFGWHHTAWWQRHMCVNNLPRVLRMMCCVCCTICWDMFQAFWTDAHCTAAVINVCTTLF